MLNRKLGCFIVLCTLLLLFFYILFFNNNEVINSLTSYYNYNSTNGVDYYGLLEIPKIELTKRIYNINDYNNNVNKNILLVNDNLNLIVLASHSGSSPISYFNNLEKLDYDDQIILKINNRKRSYRFFKKEYAEKTGRVKVEVYPYPVIVLITCSKVNKHYQELYYARLNMSANIS